jgi:hypothetical protein
MEWRSDEDGRKWPAKKVLCTKGEQVEVEEEADQRWAGAKS